METAVKTPMTKLEIINELIVNGYAKDPSTRGYSEAEMGCVYRTPEGNRCAVGKCINNIHIAKVAEVFDDVYGLDCTLADEFGLTLDEAMFKKYRGHEIEFWGALQLFHDADANFTEEGLSNLGKDNLERLKERFV